MSPISCSLQRILLRSLRCVTRDIHPAGPYLSAAGIRPLYHRCFLHSARLSSSTSSYDTKPILPDVWEFQTEPFGKLIVEAPFHVDVRPLDPLSCPSQDRIQVTLKNEEEKLVPEWMRGVECQVDYDPSQHVLRVTGDLNESGYADFPSLESIPIFLEVFIPIKYDVDIVTRHHGRVSVKGLECDIVDVSTEAGMTNLAGLKARRIRISSSFGDINVGGSLYGDVDLLTAGEGSLNLHKIQGSLTASTEAGALWIKSAYVNRCSLSTTGGDVRVTNLTGDDNQVTSLHGDLTLDSVDGCLEATTQTGNIVTTFSRVPSLPSLVARVASESGDIDVKVESEVSANVFVAGEEIHIDPAFEILDLVDEVGEDGVRSANTSSNNDKVENDKNANHEGRSNQNSVTEEAPLSLRQAGVKVGSRETESVIHVVSKLGSVSLSKKDWFGAFKFGN